MPVLLIWGEDDPALGVNLAQTIQKSFTGNLEVKYVENAGHFVHHDAAEKVNEMMRQWLEDDKHNLGFQRLQSTSVV